MLTCDFSTIVDPDFDTPKCFEETYAFKLQMKNKAYGSSELNTAWFYFKTGYQYGWTAAGGVLE